MIATLVKIERKLLSKEWKKKIRQSCIGINKEKNNGNYIDGRCSKTYYCKEKNCNNKISYRAWKYGSRLCNSCCRKGKHHSIETIKLISKSKLGRKNPNYKNGIKHRKVYCIDCNIRLKNNYAKRCKSCAQKYRAKHLTKDEKQKMSERVSGKNNPMFGKLPKHGIYGKYKGIKMRSSWELLFAKFLDLSGIEWLYEPKAFNLENYTYTPDFYLPEFDCYIEIKGVWIHDAKQKFRKFCKLYSNINIKVFNETKLSNYGVI